MGARGGQHSSRGHGGCEGGGCWHTGSFSSGKKEAWRQTRASSAERGTEVVEGKMASERVHGRRSTVGPQLSLVIEASV